MDWIYGQIVGFLGNFFALMGNMGVELFELDWVNAIVLFFSRLGWALFAVSVVVCAFECGIEYTAGRGNLQQCALNVIKGFLAVSLFTVVPVRLYALSVSLQGTFSAGLTGYGRSIGEVGQDIVTELSEIQTLSDAVNSTHFGLDVITSPIMILFCVILMAYAVLKVFFANLKRGGILLIQIAVGSLYMFSIPRGYLDGFVGWMKQVIGLCLTAFLQSTILIAGLMIFKDHALMGVGLMLSAGEVPRIAGNFGVDTTTKARCPPPMMHGRSCMSRSAWTTTSSSQSACRSPSRRNSRPCETWPFRKRSNGWRSGSSIPRPWLGTLPHRKRRNDQHPQKIRPRRFLRQSIQGLHMRLKMPAHLRTLPSRTARTYRHPKESSLHMNRCSLTFSTEPWD